jgi:hypothetical protein
MNVRVLDAVASLFLALGLVVVVTPPTWFLRPISMAVEGGRLVFVREVPWGPVSGETRLEVLRLDGMQCTSGGWAETHWQEVEGNAVSYPVPAWMQPCIEAGPPYYITALRRVRLFGLIPLRTLRTTTDIHDPKEAGL